MKYMVWIVLIMMVLSIPRLLKTKRIMVINIDALVLLVKHVFTFIRLYVHCVIIKVMAKVYYYHYHRHADKQDYVQLFKWVGNLSTREIISMFGVIYEERNKIMHARGKLK